MSPFSANLFRAGVVISSLTWLTPARADLKEYIARPDNSFSWKLKAVTNSLDGKIYELSVKSQTWQGIPWVHQLMVYQPQGMAPRSSMLLMNTGGSAGRGMRMVGMELARKCGGPVAILFQVPNQPLLDGKKEDGLIAETFVRFLRSQDENWPLLFPMVKSVIRAMDAVQEFSKSEWQQPVKGFIITGASKRGWTSWLTAATGDARVQAIAPMVIDVLNMRAQMDHQMRSFGAFSEMIRDYTERGLVPMPNGPEAQRLWRMVDPYSYREMLTLPKLILLGNNDPYWTVDALNLYWEGLKGNKWILYVPNAGHNLQQNGKDPSRAINAATAFVRHQNTGQPMPQLRWRHREKGNQLVLTVESTPVPKGARLWVAQSPTRDFRKARWEEKPVKVIENHVEGQVAFPRSGFLAFYAELDFQIESLPFHLSTQMRVVGQTAPGGGN